MELMENLYRIDKRINEIFFKEVDDETGEVTDDVFTKIESLEISKQALIENVAMKYKEMNGFINVVSEEQKRLAKLKQIADRDMEKIKAYLLKNVTEKMSNEHYSVNFHNSNSIEIEETELDTENIEILYPELIRTKKEIDKNECKRLYKETGILPNGIRYIEKKSITIK